MKRWVRVLVVATCSSTLGCNSADPDQPRGSSPPPSSARVDGSGFAAVSENPRERDAVPGPSAPTGAASESASVDAGTDAPTNAEVVRSYLHGIDRKIQPLWQDALPKDAELAGREGSAVVGFTLDAQGNVTKASIERASGIAEFDERVRQAVVKGSPYGPLPDTLKPTFKSSIRFNVAHPLVRPPSSARF